MPMRCCDLSSLMRIVESLSSEVALDRALRLRFAYGTMPPWYKATKRGITAMIGSDRVSLDVPVAVTLDDDMATAAFIVKEGERLCFVPTYASLMDAASGEERVDPERSLLDMRVNR